LGSAAPGPRSWRARWRAGEPAGRHVGRVANQALAALEPGETLRGAPDGVQAVAFSPRGDLVAAAGLSSRVVVWSTASGRVVRAMRVPEAVPLWSIAFGPDGRLIAAGGDDGAVRVWREGDARPWRVLRGPSSPLEAVVFAPSGRRVAAVGRDRAVTTWDVATAAVVEMFAGPPGATAVAYSGRTGQVAAALASPLTEHDRAPETWVRLWTVLPAVSDP
jgi:WD40 repeat protein